jgi:hypothetical protein
MAALGARWSTQSLRRASKALSVCLAAVALFTPTRARAEQRLRLSVHWEKFAEVIRTAGASLLPEMGWHLGSTEASLPLTPAEESPSPWVGRTARLSVVARDWGGTELVVGHLTPTDQVRLSRSIRMLVARVRATEGRIVPFAQVGMGQWRVDTNILPMLRPDVEVAGQLGAGVEIALGPSAAIALETDYTILYREEHESQMVNEPHLWGSFLAARGRF